MLLTSSELSICIRTCDNDYLPSCCRFFDDPFQSWLSLPLSFYFLECCRWSSWNSFRFFFLISKNNRNIYMKISFWWASEWVRRSERERTLKINFYIYLSFLFISRTFFLVVIFDKSNEICVSLTVSTRTWYTYMTE